MKKAPRNAALVYPYAVEHDGKLQVGYSNSGGGRPRWRGDLQPRLENIVNRCCGLL